MATASSHDDRSNESIWFDPHRLPPLRIAVSGSSGLVGNHLCPLLQSSGHEVVKIVRSASDDPQEIAAWESEREAARLGGTDAVIHLAGKPIAEQRWSEGVKREIRDSRVEKTGLLCERLAALPSPPKTLLCASGVNIYGDSGDTMLTEASPPGGDFLAEVAKQWEAACAPARGAGIRVVHLRFGMVLSTEGGALPKLLMPARFGGGWVGDGKQWWSWIAIADVVGAIYHTLATDSVEGPVNFTAPAAVRNREFSATLGRVLHRPAIVPAPALALRLLLGEMADSLLLASTRVHPEVLLTSGYDFRFPELEAALRHLLGRS